jgi:hypothetical protein
MTTEQTPALISQLVGGDISAARRITQLARTSDDPLLLSAAAFLVPGAPGLLARATQLATSTRDRQVVAIVTAHLTGDHDRAGALAQDHLADQATPHPGAALVAWICARPVITAQPPSTTHPTQENR